MEPLQQKDTNNTANFTAYIYYQDQNADIRVVFTLWVEPEAPGAVVVPLEPGLELSHLFLDPVQEEGVHETLGVTFALGQPEVL